MNLDAIKERFLEELKNTWQKWTESSVFLKIRERYNEWPSNIQKLSIAGAIFVFLLILLAWPLSQLSSSWDSTAEFEENKNMIRDLLQVQRDSSQVPIVNPATPSSALKATVTDALSKAGLAPDQIFENIETKIHDDKTSSLIPAQIDQLGVQVHLLKLTVRQILDISYMLQSLDSSAKLLSVDVRASAKDDHYFDVIFRLLGFASNGPVAKNDAGSKKDILNAKKFPSENLQNEKKENDTSDNKKDEVSKGTFE